MSHLFLNVWDQLLNRNTGLCSEYTEQKCKKVLTDSSGIMSNHIIIINICIIYLNKLSGTSEHRNLLWGKVYQVIHCLLPGYDTLAQKKVIVLFSFSFHQQLQRLCLLFFNALTSHPPSQLYFHLEPSIYAFIHFSLHQIHSSEAPQDSFPSQNTERRSTVVLKRHQWEKGWETQSLIQLPALSLHSPVPQQLYPCIKVEVAVTVLQGGCHGC